MRSLFSILLLLVMVVSAFGLPQGLHQHQQHSCHTALPAGHLAPDEPLPAHPHTCTICLQFRAPTAPPPAHAWLIDSGAWVRYVSMLAVAQRPQPLPSRMSCRGPPPSPRSC